MSIALVQLKWLMVFIILAKYFTVICDEKIKHSVYVRGVQCNASDKYIYPNFTCFAKSWSRTVSTVNVIATTRMPLNEIHFEAQIFYRYGNIYREVIHTPRVEWCGMARDYLQPKIPTPLSVVLQIASETAPGAVHQCPYTGLNVRNATYNTNALKSVFPTGQYRLSLYVYAVDNESIAVLNVYAEMNSPLKESFGRK